MRFGSGPMKVVLDPGCHENLPHLYSGTQPSPCGLISQTLRRLSELVGHYDGLLV